jgi:S-adenosylmethionine-dependent methyltransferase
MKENNVTVMTKFDDKIAGKNNGTSWAKLKYRLVQSNLAKHLSQAQMHILDAGGGNGLDSVSLQSKDFERDYSQEMLSDIQPQERVITHLADIRNISSLFPDSHFDLIMCHNVLQYISDVPALIESFSKLLKPDGIISVVSVNRYSTPYHAAFLDGNFDEAVTLLESRSSKAKMFSTI